MSNSRLEDAWLSLTFRSPIFASFDLSCSDLLIGVHPQRFVLLLLRFELGLLLYDDLLADLELPRAALDLLLHFLRGEKQAVQFGQAVVDSIIHALVHPRKSSFFNMRLWVNCNNLYPKKNRRSNSTGGFSRQLAALAASTSRKPLSCLARTGCCSLRTALASICRTRSRVTLKMRPTSSRV